MIKFTVYRRPNLSSVEDPMILPIKVGWLQEFTKAISIPQQPLTFSTFYTLYTLLTFSTSKGPNFCYQITKFSHQ